MTIQNSVSSRRWSDASRPGPARTCWEARFPWEGDRLLARLQSVMPAEGPLQILAYLSESPEIRRMTELKIAEQFHSPGRPCTVRLRSAYKAGYFWMTEEVQPLWRRLQADRLVLTYPAGPSGQPDRYLQELYPLSAVLEREGLQWEFVAGPPNPVYRVALFQGEAPLWQGDCLLPLQARASLDGREVLAPTGWLQVRAGEQVRLEERLETDGELFWDWYCEEVVPELLPLAEQRPEKPIFKNLQVTLAVSEPDLTLDVLGERVSMTEALSEEIYFGTVDALKWRLGLPAQSRTLQPGRIVPVVTARSGQDGRVRVTLTEWGVEETPPEDRAGDSPDAVPGGAVREAPALLAAAGPRTPLQIWQLARSEAQRHGLGWHVPASSVEGRPIPAVVRPGLSASGGVLVTGGQHANEPTGPVAALQLIGALAQTTLPFAVLPLENPDGASLHRTLTRLNPEHMHHAARYTSLGDDLQFRLQQGTEGWEARGRAWAAREIGATLHLSLHGYPAHEWVRPYSGYAPLGFESWAIPAGFMTIVQHHPGFGDEARRLAEAIASGLQQHRDVTQHAEAACRAHAAHSTRAHYELIGGLPFIVSEQPQTLCPLTVITEAPDETVYGEYFQMMVRAQLAVCAASVAYQEGNSSV